MCGSAGVGGGGDHRDRSGNRDREKETEQEMDASGFLPLWLEHVIPLQARVGFRGGQGRGQLSVFQNRKQPRTLGL